MLAMGGNSRSQENLTVLRNQTGDGVLEARDKIQQRRCAAHPVAVKLVPSLRHYRRVHS